MSLQVWLPLNGDLHNQGLSNITVTNNGATIDNNGKIGKCYSFNGSNQKITGTSSSSISSAIGSLACWVKFNSLPSSSAWFNLMQLGATGGFAACRLGMYVEYGTGINISINGSSTGANYKAYSFSTGTWYHICTVYDGTKVKLYINGAEQLNKTASVGSYTTSASTLFIGGTNNYYLNGCINDCRYYDHALSAKEVEEIAKGLVLYYKLNDRFCEPTTNLLTATGSCPTDRDYTVATYATVVDSNCTTGNYIITYSAYIKNTSNVSLNVRCSPFLVAGSYGAFQGNVIPAGSEGWSSITCDLTDSSKYTGVVYVYIQNGSPGSVPSSPNFKIYHAQIERKSYRTPWVLGGTSRTPSTIYDSSGYDNNGTIIGTLEISTPSPRYSCATYINSPDPTTNSAAGEYYILANCALTTPSTISISWWSYPENGYGGSATAHGIWSTTANDIASDYQTAAFNHRDSRFDVNSSDGSHLALSTSSFVGSAWHHYVVTYDGQTAKLYKDGAQQTSVAFSAVKTLGSFTKVLIGHSRAGGVHRKVKGKYSDFRIYATALTDAQVQELYKTSMLVSGNTITPRNLA